MYVYIYIHVYTHSGSYFYCTYSDQLVPYLPRSRSSVTTSWSPPWSWLATDVWAPRERCSCRRRGEGPTGHPGNPGNGEFHWPWIWILVILVQISMDFYMVKSCKMAHLQMNLDDLASGFVKHGWKIPELNGGF